MFARATLVESVAFGAATTPACLLAEVLNDEMRRLPAYDMTWLEDQETIASRLKEAGYETSVSYNWGKTLSGDRATHE
ncbi:MAG: hypothetical protein AAF198_02050 [Pseudomonadota bacterium]